MVGLGWFPLPLFDAAFTMTLIKALSNLMHFSHKLSISVLDRPFGGFIILHFKHLRMGLQRLFMIPFWTIAIIAI